MATILRDDNEKATAARRRNVRTHHGASYRPDGNDNNHGGDDLRGISHSVVIVARSTSGRTVVRPYIASSKF
jgi:hypothetical protein